MCDPHVDIADQHWSPIVMLYERHVDKKPVMLFDIQQPRIYVLPYAEYPTELSEASQAYPP